MLTRAGPLRARYVVDATGWRSVLAEAVQPGFLERSTLSGGIEAELPYREDGLHFWVGSDIIRGGYAWVFPCGETARIGVLAFGRTGGLRPAMRSFFTRLGLPPDPDAPYHGGQLPFVARSVMAGPVFVAGDAAGMCFGLTGEGIRSAATFAVRCGRLLREVLAGERTGVQRSAGLHALLSAAPAVFSADDVVAVAGGTPTGPGAVHVCTPGASVADLPAPDGRVPPRLETRLGAVTAAGRERLD